MRDILRRQADEDREVAQADPFEGDSFFRSAFIPLNKERNLSSLLNQSLQFAQRALSLTRPTRVQALAGVRDLGMMTAAVVRAGGKSEELAVLRTALKHLAGATDEVPRDTVFSYGPRNPVGERERTFTDTSDERSFIASFRRGISATSECIGHLYSACLLSVDAPAFSSLLRDGISALSKVVDTMVMVRSEVRPTVFTAEVRPYLDVIEIDGSPFIAPGGGQIPMLALDMMIWADYIDDYELHRYLRDNVEYYPRVYRDLISDLEGRPSILTRVAAAPQNRDLAPAAKALDLLLAQLERFRFPHKKVTEENMKLRSYGSFQMDVLSSLLSSTAEARARSKALAGRW